MALKSFNCGNCGKPSFKEAGHLNRSAAIGAQVYCSRKCAGLARRKPALPERERKALKSEYDRKRRERLGEGLLIKKREAYQLRVQEDADRLRAEQKEHRRKRKNAHAEYCRQPEYREWKRKYDRKYRAKKDYGSWAETALILRDLEDEISKNATRIEIGMKNGTINKSQNRKRAYAISKRSEPEVGPLGHAPNGACGSYGSRAGR